MDTLPSESDKRLGAFPYVIGGLSYIPLIGVIFGIISIVWGLLRRGKAARHWRLLAQVASGLRSWFMEVLVISACSAEAYSRRCGGSLRKPNLTSWYSRLSSTKSHAVLIQLPLKSFKKTIQMP